MQVRMDRIRPLIFAEDGHELRIQYSNRGEPFRDGVEFTFDSGGINGRSIWVLLDRQDVETLRDKLTEFLATKD